MRDMATTTTTVAQKWIVCRVCLQQPKEAMACIFNDDATKDLTSMILECGGVPIKKFDHYPDKICDKCLKCLHISYKFRRNCQRSYKHLSQFMAPVGEPGETVESKLTPNLQPELSEAQELPDEIEQEILVDLEKDMIVDVKSEDVEVEGITEELYDVYETYETADEVIERYGEEIAEQSLSGLSADIEYIEQIDQDQLTESAQEDDADVQQQNTSDEEFVPINARMINTHVVTTRSATAAATSGNKRHVNTRKPSPRGKMGAKRAQTSSIDWNSDEVVTLGESIVRKAPAPKTRGGRKIYVGDKKEFKYICDICGNLYPSQSRLTEHIKVHSGVKPHECEICGHAFAQAQQLARHMNTHTGNRPYKCSYCPAAFADLSTRNKHHRIHTNERPYECDVCHKTFTYTNTLKFHKMIHTGEKPHVCDICGKGFPQLYKLRNHKITHERRPCREQPFNSLMEIDAVAAVAEL